MQRLIVTTGRPLPASYREQMKDYRWVHVEERRAVKAAMTLQPDAVLLLRARHPATLAEELRAGLPGTAVLVVVGKERAAERRECLVVGVQFYGRASPSNDGHAIIESAIRNAQSRRGLTILQGGRR